MKDKNPTKNPNNNHNNQDNQIRSSSSLESPGSSSSVKKSQLCILITAFVISACGISYELLEGTICSYFLGNAVFQYSMVIGIYLFAMGLGSYISRKFDKNLEEVLIVTAILIGFFGGFTTVFLFLAYRYTEVFSLLLYSHLIILGTLIGLAVPLLIRMLKEYKQVKFSISDILSFDYVGSLLASILFPILVLPLMGMMHASFFYALMNMVVVFLNLSVFRHRLQHGKKLTAVALIVTILLLGGLLYSSRLVSFFEARLYDDEIIFLKQTQYQRIVLTRYNQDLRLYLDGNLQFSSWDEYRYHECLVHPAMSGAFNREEVLILGGGDGLAAREVLKYADVQRITLVDIDKDMVDLCKTDAHITQLNKGSLTHPKMNIVIEDAYTYLQNSQQRFSVIISDLPDPNNESLSKLYTTGFYTLIRQHLAKGGMVSIQSTSPYFARNAYWCIVHTVQDAGLEAVPYHVFVPSFGDWGFTLASNLKIDPHGIKVEVPTQYLKEGNIQHLFYFGKDEDEVDTNINRLDNHYLLQYYESDWKHWE